LVQNLNKEEKILLKECYNDYTRCLKDSSVSDTWFHTGSQNIKYFKNNSLEDLSINSNLKALFHIDGYPSTTFLNNNISELLKFQKHERLKFYKKIELNKKKISASHLVHYRNFLKIKNYINFGGNVLEIGGGSGILSSMIHRSFNTKNFMCDIPETLVFQKYYIKKNFKNIKTQFIANSDDKINFKNDFFFINSSQLLRIKLDLDIVINIDSFSEMDKKTVLNYLHYAEKKLKKNGVVYLSNTIGHSKNGYHFPSEIPIPQRFRVEDLGVYYPTARDNYSKYLNIILKKMHSPRIYKINKELIKFFYLKSDYFICKNSYKIFKRNILHYLNKGQSYKNYIIRNKFLPPKLDYIQDLNIEKLFVYLFKKILFFLKNKKKQQIKKLYFLLCNDKLKKNDLKNDVSIVSRLILLSLVFSKKINKKYLDLIPENSFEKIFIKFNFLNKNNKLKNIYLKKLIKFKNPHYFEILKIYYCATIAKNVNIKKKTKKLILNKAKNKLSILYYLKLLLLVGDIKEFIVQYNYFLQKKLISLSDIFSDLVSINATRKRDIIAIYQLINKEIDIKNSSNKGLPFKIIQLKALVLKEEEFLIFLKKNYWNDYYNLGYVLKNTLNFMTKNNIDIIAKRSLSLRNNLMNKLFITDIYFFNFMKQRTLNIFSKIKRIEDLNMYYLLKKIITEKSTNLEIRDLIQNNFFKIFNSGYFSFIPFLNAGNNQVGLTNMNFFKDNKTF
jgi:hypothetical protein